MRWSVGSKIGGGFALSLAVLVIIGVVSYRSSLRLIETAKWVAQKLKDLVEQSKVQGYADLLIDCDGKFSRSMNRCKRP